MVTANSPKIFVVEEYDCFRRDSEAYYKKLKATNHQVEKIILPGQTHNTFVMRKTMSDGKDLAEVVAGILVSAVVGSCLIKI